MWAANKRAGMPFSKLVNAAHHSQTISALFSLESLSNVLCVSFLVFFPPLLSSLFIFLSVVFAPSRKEHQSGLDYGNVRRIQSFVTLFTAIWT